MAYSVVHHIHNNTTTGLCICTMYTVKGLGCHAMCQGIPVWQHYKRSNNSASSRPYSDIPWSVKYIIIDIKLNNLSNNHGTYMTFSKFDTKLTDSWSECNSYQGRTNNLLLKVWKLYNQCSTVWLREEIFILITKSKTEHNLFQES